MYKRDISLKDTVRFKRGSVSLKDGIPYSFGKGTVLSFDTEYAKVYFFTCNSTKQVHISDIIKTRR